MPFVQSKSVQTSGAASITTASFTSSQGNAIFAGVDVASQAIPVTPVTDSKSNSYSNAWVNNAGGTERGGLYYNSNITGGASHTVTLTPTSSTGCALMILEFSGIKNSGALDVTVNTRVGSALHKTGISSTTAQADEVLIGMCTVDTLSGTPASIEAFNDAVSVGDTGPEGGSLSWAFPGVAAAYTQTQSLSGNVGIATFKCSASADFVQAKSVQGNGAATITTAAMTSTSGNFFGASASSFGTALAVSPTLMSDSKSNTWVGAYADNSNWHLGCYYVENITGGASHTVTFSPGGGFTQLGVCEFSGINTSSSLDKTASNITTATTAVLSQANELVLAAATNGNSATAGISTGTWTSLWTDVVLNASGPTPGIIMSYRTVSVIRQYSYARTGNTEAEAIGLASFKLAPSGGPGAGANPGKGGGKKGGPKGGDFFGPTLGIAWGSVNEIGGN